MQWQQTLDARAELAAKTLAAAEATALRAAQSKLGEDQVIYERLTFLGEVPMLCALASGNACARTTAASRCSRRARPRHLRASLSYGTGPACAALQFVASYVVTVYLMQAERATANWGGERTRLTSELTTLRQACSHNHKTMYPRAMSIT